MFFASSWRPLSVHPTKMGTISSEQIRMDSHIDIHTTLSLLFLFSRISWVNLVYSTSRLSLMYSAWYFMACWKGLGLVLDVVHSLINLNRHQRAGSHGHSHYTFEELEAGVSWVTLRGRVISFWKSQSGVKLWSYCTGERGHSQYCPAGASLLTHLALQWLRDQANLISEPLVL